MQHLRSAWTRTVLVFEGREGFCSPTRAVVL